MDRVLKPDVRAMLQARAERLAAKAAVAARHARRRAGGPTKREPDHSRERQRPRGPRRPERESSPRRPERESSSIREDRAYPPRPQYCKCFGGQCYREFCPF